MNDDATSDYLDRLQEDCLLVDFCGVVSVVEPGQVLSFGREADLEIDENPFLHRRLGHFEWASNLWWVANTGTKIDISVFDRNTRASALVTPGTSHALTGSDLVVRFVAGRQTYELLVTCPVQRTVSTAQPSDTVGLDSIPWTEEQRLLLTILAEQLLRDGTATETFKLPTNLEARERLGWSEAKFNRKLDGICDRLTDSGVRGLAKGVNSRNTMRRRVLAIAAVSRGIVDTDDLAGLEAYEKRVTPDSTS